MIQGLNKFQEWFDGFDNRYVIIGGIACNMIYSAYGAPQRATRDVDMVIVAEAFDKKFYLRFIEFIKAGGYEHKNKAGEYELYRFEKPSDNEFPYQIELLSKRPEIFQGIESSLGKFETIDADYSISAIMLDDDYYELLSKGIVQIEGLPVLSLDYLPVFKIHAWANLSDMKADGKFVSHEDIGKHRRDVLRLCSLFEPGKKIKVSNTTKKEIARFVDEQPWDDNMLKNLNLNITSDQMADIIRSVYL